MNRENGLIEVKLINNEFVMEKNLEIDLDHSQLKKWIIRIL